MKFLTLTIYILAILISLLLVLNLKFTKRVEGVTFNSPITNIYIPSTTPIKVYTFDPHPRNLEEQLNQLIDSNDSNFGIYIKNLTTGQVISINGEKSFQTASLYKLAVMYTIFKLGSENKLNIDDLTIQRNLHAMIEYSSNEAADYLVTNYASWDTSTKAIQDLGLKSTALNQSPPITTAEDMGLLLELISDGKTINLETSEKMLELLAAQQKNDRIPLLLPAGTIVAHKTGELDDVRHDAGLVVGPDNNYILVVLGENPDHPEKIAPITAQISKVVYDFFNTQWQNPPEIL